MKSNKVIEIDHLSYDYPDGTPALRDIDLEVYQHESVAILGPNGAGKSTLLYHLNGTLMGDGKGDHLGSPGREREFEGDSKKGRSRLPKPRGSTLLSHGL